LRRRGQPAALSYIASHEQRRRVCQLLSTWLHDYPWDLSVPGAAGALHALVKTIAAQPHLLHYATALVPFLEMLPRLTDHDAAWAVRGLESPLSTDADLPSSDGHALPAPAPPAPPATPAPAPLRAARLVCDAGAIADEITRLQHVMFLEIKASASRAGGAPWADAGRQPRDWLHWIHRYSQKETDPNAVSRFLDFVNHLAEW
jgi:hypothetical protein